MSVRWSVRSKEVHTSKATWVGAKPTDGGKALLLEAFDFVRTNKQSGQMIVNFGLAGAIGDLTFIQSELVPSPALEFDADES